MVVKTLITVLCCFFLMVTTTMTIQAESLQEEFDSLCIHTQEAEDLSMENLQELITQCDYLKKKIEVSTDEKKKVLLFRLDKCRKFFIYIMEIKQSGN